MNSLLLTQLAARLCRVDAVTAYANATERHPDAFRPYSTPLEAVNRALGKTRKGDDGGDPNVDTFLRAVVAEYQSSRSDVWATMLLVAFFPCVLRLRQRAQRPRYDRDDLLAIVIESFLSAARELPCVETATYLPVYLQREMSRRTFERLARDRRDRERAEDAITDALSRRRVEPFVGAREEASPHPLEQVQAREELGRVVQAFGPSFLEVLGQKLPSLRALTDAVRSDLSDRDREGLYQRTKRWAARLRAGGADSNQVASVWLALGRKQ